MQRRIFLSALLSGVAAALLGSPAAEADHGYLFGHSADPKRKKRLAERKARLAASKRANYKGRQTVTYITSEKPGTIIIKTRERALYYVLGSRQAVRYGVAVGKEGFSWSGTARIGMKKVNPRWTPPAEMIVRTPKYAKWAGGMPGGIPENPLGVRAIYLFNRSGDTGFRIHGTNAPSSIGTAASSGCIRMLNHEVVELYGKVRIGAKVIVL